MQCRFIAYVPPPDGASELNNCLCTRASSLQEVTAWRQDEDQPSAGLSRRDPPSFTLHSPPFTLHPQLSTLHPPPSTLTRHPTPDTLHPACSQSITTRENPVGAQIKKWTHAEHLQFRSGEMFSLAWYRRFFCNIQTYTKPATGISGLFVNNVYTVQGYLAHMQPPHPLEPP